MKDKSAIVKKDMNVDRSIAFAAFAIAMIKYGPCTGGTTDADVDANANANTNAFNRVARGRLQCIVVAK